MVRLGVTCNVSGASRCGVDSAIAQARSDLTAFQGQTVTELPGQPQRCAPEDAASYLSRHMPDLFASGSRMTDAHCAGGCAATDNTAQNNRVLNRHTFLTVGVSASYAGPGIRDTVGGDAPVWTGAFANVVVNFWPVQQQGPDR